MNKLYRDVIAELRNTTGRNIVAWSANNAGNGGRNLHVAELENGVARATTFKSQTGVVRDGFTAHWRGTCTSTRILSAIS
jgi:hypothetical protein